MSFQPLLFKIASSFYPKFIFYSCLLFLSTISIFKLNLFFFTSGSAYHSWQETEHSINLMQKHSICVTSSLRIQPPLTRSRYYVRNAKPAGSDERRLYSQATSHLSIKIFIALQKLHSDAAGRILIFYLCKEIS